METSAFLREEALLPGLRVAGKKQLLQELSQLASRFTGVDTKTILDVLEEREKLGSTGAGKGVAIPHGRLSGIDKVQGFFARLDRPVEFGSVDGQPVDLVFLLLTPATAGPDHLKALSRVSRVLRNPETCDAIRKAENQEQIYHCLTTQ
jgi:PTS system nitrogen regulatory IIA component